MKRGSRKKWIWKKGRKTKCAGPVEVKRQKYKKEEVKPKSCRRSTCTVHTVNCGTSRVGKKCHLRREGGKNMVFIRLSRPLLLVHMLSQVNLNRSLTVATVPLEVSPHKGIISQGEEEEKARED
jgi:hypothetical protein